MTPLWAQLVSAAPKFNDTKVRWRSFSRDWMDYVQRFGAAQPGGVADDNILQVLVDNLGLASKAMVRQTKEEQGRITYDLVWRKLQQKFGSDANASDRQAWRQIKLQFSGRPQVFSEKYWLLFQSNFKLLMDRLLE